MNFNHLPYFKRLNHGSDGTYSGIVSYTHTGDSVPREIGVTVTYSETVFVQNSKYVYKTSCVLSPEAVILLVSKIL